jgi:hypothetical protein
MTELVAGLDRPRADRSVPWLHAPAIIQRGRSFLADVTIEHGPRDVLSRLFRQADAEMRDAGIRPTLATFSELLALNEANRASWRPLLPVFNPELSDIPEDNGFAVIGRNASGEAVTANAYRLIDLGTKTLKEQIESLRIFYSDPNSARRPYEAMSVSAPRAAQTRGRIVFSGAA